MEGLVVAIAYMSSCAPSLDPLLAAVPGARERGERGIERSKEIEDEKESRNFAG